MFHLFHVDQIFASKLKYINSGQLTHYNTHDKWVSNQNNCESQTRSKFNKGITLQKMKRQVEVANK